MASRSTAKAAAAAADEKATENATNTPEPDVTDEQQAPSQAATLDNEDAEPRNDPNDNDRVTDAATGIKEPELPLQPTATDANGVARALPRLDRGWEPAPLEATDEEKAAAKERNAREEEWATAQREGRIDPVSGRMLDKADSDKADR